MKSHSLIIALATSASILCGCGGGGGPGSSSSMPSAGATNLSSAPGETAMASYLQAVHKYTFKASNAGNSYTMQVSSVPNAGTTKFNGSAPAYSSVDTVTLDENGVVIGNHVSTDYFLLSHTCHWAECPAPAPRTALSAALLRCHRRWTSVLPGTLTRSPTIMTRR